MTDNFPDIAPRALPAEAEGLEALRYLRLLLTGDREGLCHALRSGGGLAALRLFRFAEAHGLSSYLLESFTCWDLLDFLPGLVAHGLRRSTDRQRARQKLLIGKMQDVRDRLAGEGIEAIFLKGPFLTQRYYEDPALRTFADLDLLVRGKEDVLRCHEVLRSMGYRRRSFPLFGYAAAMRFTHHLEYESSEAVLDLHWFLRSHFSFDIDYGRLWETSESAALPGDPEGRRFQVLSSEYVLVLLLVSIHSDIERGRPRMKYLVDVHQVLRTVDSRMEWSDFFERRSEEGLFELSHAVLDSTLTLLDSRGEFPFLAMYLDRHPCSGHRNAARHLAGFLAPSRSRFGMRNRFWAFGLYRAPIPASFLWWVLSQPFKHAMYR